MGGNKFGSKKVVVNGTKYDSKKESVRGEELKMLEKAGKISELLFQVRFELQPSFKHHGVNERKIEYVADAVYNQSGFTIVEDTKSEFTRKNPVYRLKRKLFLYKYPDLVFHEYI